MTTNPKKSRAITIAAVGIALCLLIIASFRLKSLYVSNLHRRLILKSLGQAAGASANALTISQMLTLKPVHNDEAENGIAVFELPVAYDSLKRAGSLWLLVDPHPNEDFVSGYGTYQECDRASNGDCLLEWNTAFDPPGVHNLEAALFVDEPDGLLRLYGPKVAYTSSNVCQFGVNTFHGSRVPLCATVSESDAIYRIDLQTLAGRHINSFSGRVTNGEIDDVWDFHDEAGNTITGLNELDAVFHITNSISGSLKLRLTRIPHDAP